jgi:hypothetical protein
MQGWLEFYAVTAGAAATLLGLLFVAVSINATVILGEAREDSKRLVEQAFQNYLAVLLVSLLAIVPALTTSARQVDTPRTWLGAELTRMTVFDCRLNRSTQHMH